MDDEGTSFAPKGLPPLKEEMTLLSQSQGRGYPPAESSLSALHARSTVLTCTNTGDGVASAALAAPRRRVAHASAVFADCPLCGKEPLEPVRVEGQWACRGCTSACLVCSWPCVPGDEACGECIRHLGLDRQAVLV